MIQYLLQYKIFDVQLEIKNKKQGFTNAIRNDKEFSQVKTLYLEIKELEKMLQDCQIDLVKNFK